MPDEPIHLSETNSANDYAGAILGIQRQYFLWVIIALIVGFLMFLWLTSRQKVSFPAAASVSVLPLVVTTAFLIFFCHNKPAGYFQDVVTTRVTSGDASPLRRPGSLWNPLPDCYLVNGLIVHGGPHRGGGAAKGFLLKLPSLHAASNAERNRFQNVVRQILRLVPDNCSLQVCWWNDPNYRAELSAYRTVTEAAQNPVVKRVRNLHTANFWQQMKGGKLRREHVALFVCRSLEDLPVTSIAGQAGRLDQLHVEFAELEKQIGALLAGPGGSVQPLDEAAQFRLFARKLNPSLANQPDHDPTANFALGGSLLEHSWNSELQGVPRGFLLDGYYHGVLLLKRWPTATYPGLIHKLTNLSIPDFEISVHLRRQSADQIAAGEQREIEKLDRMLARAPDERLAVSRAKKVERIRRLSQGTTLSFTAEFTIVARARTPESLSEKILALKSAVNGLNGAAYLEATLPASARNAFFKTLPGLARSGRGGVSLYAEDDYLADLLPFSSSFNGHLQGAEAIYHGAHANLVGIKTFLGGEGNATPQHAIAFGSTGTGKSVFLENLFHQAAPYYGMAVIVEEGLSHAAFTRAHGIEPIQVRLDDPNLTFNIFDTHGLPLTSHQQAVVVAAITEMTGRPKDDDRAHYREGTVSKMLARLLTEHAQDQWQRLTPEQQLTIARNAWLEERLSKTERISRLDAFLARKQMEQTGPQHLNQILAECSESVALQFAATNPSAIHALIHSELSGDRHLTLSSFREYLELNSDGEDAQECSIIATLLSPWCRGGKHGNLFDGPSTVRLDGPVIHFELGSIPDAAKEEKNLVGFLILNDVRAQLLGLPREVRKRVLLEEASRFFEIGGGRGTALAREFYEQFRKYSVQMTSVFQQYSRLADSPVRAALMGNSRLFFIFNTGDRADLARLAQDLGLPPAVEEAILRHPRPDQLAGPKFSEFTLLHTDSTQPVCGTVRFVRPADQSPT